MSQRNAWEAVAGHWAELVRDDNDGKLPADVEAFFALLPPPGRRTLDLACGEGRIARRLAELDHSVVGLDSSPTLMQLAEAADPESRYVLGDAAQLPFADGSFDLVVCFMSFQDFDDPVAAIRESGRVLSVGGSLCFAVIHPFWTGGDVDEAADRFVVRGSYLATVPHIRPVMQVPSVHRPLEAYFRGLEAAGLRTERVRELPSPNRLAGRMPAFLQVRAVKP